MQNCTLFLAHIASVSLYWLGSKIPGVSSIWFVYETQYVTAVQIKNLQATVYMKEKKDIYYLLLKGQILDCFC